MSNRDSMGFGDLLPQDVVQVFAQGKQIKGPHKKRSHSLGRALGWLKGKKKKDLGTSGHSLGLGPALDLAVDGKAGGHKGGQKSGRHTHTHGNSHAVPKRDDDSDKTPAPPLLQENVFIEASRPKYLEDLHTEALEGLKMMQQEETSVGVEYQDNESTISNMTTHTDGECEGFTTDSTIADTTSVVSVQSSVSTRSSRSGLTRQGSTFRPLNSGQKKSKRRRHRKTVAGIPQHVQKEMGLDRVGWILTQKLDEEQILSDDTDVSPTTDGLRPTAKSQRGAIASTHRDDLALLKHLGPEKSDGQRPSSVAVPWMTTANSVQQELPSPVMTMSPQAAYMSKIIPNAVLPPSIEVVEISRGQSRNSVRTVSKSSLLLSSPAPSRASSRASSSRTTSSRCSNLTSASQQKPRNISDSSCWSNSDSSDTLVSDSSTISSSTTPLQKSQDSDASTKEGKMNEAYNGVLFGEKESGKKEGPFVRSLSVMKSKKAPPPPNRSYSLHNKMKRRSRDLADLRVIPGESPPRRMPPTAEEYEKNISGPASKPSKALDSLSYNADTSSLDESTGSVSFSPIRSQAGKTEEAVKFDSPQKKQDSPQGKKKSKIISPSSGYSSQDATSPQLSKPPHSSSPRQKKGILAKLQKLFPGSSSSAQPEVTKNIQHSGHNNTNSVDTANVSPSVKTLRNLFNIPPPPKVHAPPPPPPEVWVHSRRSVELLLGPPVPDNLNAIIKKNPKDRRQQRQSPSASTDGSVKSLVVERKHKNPAVPVTSMNGSGPVIERRKVEDGLILNTESLTENNSRLDQSLEMNENGNVMNKGKVSEMLKGMLVKVEKKNEERLSAVTRELDQTSTEVRTNVVKHSASVQAVASPESSWPPPPPPLTQAGIAGPDEIDFPLPPPPLFGESGLVIPVQVPPKAPAAPTSVVTVSVTDTDPPRSASSQAIESPPLDIPPPPTYAAPPPPMQAVSPAATKRLQPPPKEVLLPPPKEFSPPPPVKEVPPTISEAVTPPPPAVDPKPPSQTPPPPPVYFPHLLPKVVSPSLRKVVSPPPPKEVSPSPPKVVSPPPSKKVWPPPPKVSPSPLADVPPPPPKDVSPPASIDISPPLPREVSPPALEIIPPLPPEEVSPPSLVVIPPPPPKEVSTLPPDNIPPPPPKEVSSLPPENIPPPPPKEVSTLPPENIPPPPPKEVSTLPPENIPPPPPKEVSTLPPENIPPPPPKEVSTLPPENIPPPPPKEVSSLPLENIPPPPPKEVSPPPVESIPAPSPKEVSPLPEENITPPPPKVVSTLPPENIPPPPPKEVSPPPEESIPAPPPKEISPPPPVEVTIPPPEEVVPKPPKESSPLPPDEVHPPKQSSPDLNMPTSVEILDPSTEEVVLLCSQESVPELEETFVGKLQPPQSIPPPPPLLSHHLEQVVDTPQEDIQPVPEANHDSSNSILVPSQSLPSPPQVEPTDAVATNTDGPTADEVRPSPPSKDSPETSPSTEKAQESAPPSSANIPLLTEQDSTSNVPQSISVNTDNQEQSSVCVIQEILTPVEAPKPPEEPQTEVPVTNQNPVDQVPSTSNNGEAPQKPIRRSLIIISPTSTSPPTIVTTPPSLPKSQSIVSQPASSPPPTNKTSPTTTSSPSMRLQEAIRLRTAARSKETTTSTSRLSLQAPTSPVEAQWSPKSPTSTASFIFSKGHRKVVTETRPVPDTKGSGQNKLDVSSVTAVNKTQSFIKASRVPPPVAKKPTTKAKESEISEGTERTAGLEAQKGSVHDGAEKINGTAGPAEGGEAPST